MTSDARRQPPASPGFLHLSRFLPEDQEGSGRGTSASDPDAAVDAPARARPSAGPTLIPSDAMGKAGAAGPNARPVREVSPEPAARSVTPTSAATASVDAVRLLDHAAAESARILGDANDRAARLIDEACADAAAAAARVLEEARREAYQVLEDARSEADAIRQEAVADAARLRMEGEAAVLAARDEATAEASRRHMELDHQVRTRQAELEAESIRVLRDAQQQALTLLKDAEHEREEMLAQARREADRLLDLGAHAIAGAERQAAALVQAATESASAAQSRTGQVVEPVMTAGADRPSGSDDQAHPGDARIAPTAADENREEDLRFEPVIGSRGRVVGGPGPDDAERDADPQTWGTDFPGARRRRRPWRRGDS